MCSVLMLAFRGQDAVLVHEARAVGPYYVLGAGGHVAHHLVAAHLARHGVLLNGKHAAKAAALVAALGLDHLDIAHQASMRSRSLLVQGTLRLRAMTGRAGARRGSCFATDLVGETDVETGGAYDVVYEPRISRTRAAGCDTGGRAAGGRSGRAQTTRMRPTGPPRS